MADDDIATTGPLNAHVGGRLARRASGWHAGWGADLILALIALHVLAIGWYTLRRREPLLRAMWSGDKPLPPARRASRDDARVARCWRWRSAAGGRRRRLGARALGRLTRARLRRPDGLPRCQRRDARRGRSRCVMHRGGVGAPFRVRIDRLSSTKAGFSREIGAMSQGNPLGTVPGATFKNDRVNATLVRHP